MSTNGNRVLVIFHTKQAESGFELGIYSMHFIYSLTLPNLCLHKPLLTKSSGACQSTSYHGRVSILSSFLCHGGLTNSLQN